MTRSLLARLTLLAAAAPGAAAQCFTHSFQPTNLVVGALGASIDVDGAWGIVGEPGRDHVWSDSGAAHIINALSGKKVRVLLPSDPEKNAGFGRAVAIDGGFAAIGAWADDAVGNGAGAVYLFDVSSGTELVKVTSPTPDPGAIFGYSVAAWGGFVLVGAPGDDKVVSQGGAVYVHEQITGTFLHELTVPVGQADMFGYTVELDGGIALVGAPNADGSHADTGRVYAFDIATGVLLQELIPSGLAGGEGIGRQLAIDGNLAALCTSMDTVHVFDVTTGLELAVHTFPSDFPGIFDASLSLDGSELLVGQPYERGADDRSGRALRVDALTGALLEVIVHPASAYLDRFGEAVYLTGGRAFIGAPGMDSVIADQGAYFLVEDCAPIGTSYCGPAVPNSRGLAAELVAFGSDVVAADDLSLRMDALPTGRFGMFLVSATQDFVPLPGGSSGNLCLGGQIGRYAADVEESSNLGHLYLAVDLAALPLTPTHAVQPGETWNFQGWYRDEDPTPTSNFTDGRAILFQ